MEDFIICQCCGGRFKQITEKHLLRCNNITVKDYKIKYPTAKLRAESVTIKTQNYNKIYKSGINNPMKNPEHLSKMKQNQIKIVSSDAHRNKLSKSHLDPDSYFQKWIKSPEYIQLLIDAYNNMPEEIKNERRKFHRIRRLNEINKHCELIGKRIFVNFNPIACKIIDEYGDKFGYNFQHAMNGGEYHIKELGYFVDGYDKENNVVIEYYEPRHYRRQNLIRDMRRQTEIIDYLKCKFIIIDGRNNTVKYIN